MEAIPERNGYMQKKKPVKKPAAILPLLLIYAGSVLVRFLLAMGTRNYPTVSIDEFLYYSLGRSIATTGSLLYHGQAALYNYIVYPLVIAPVYALFPHGTDYFRIIELLNILIMSLSVFPLYGICNTLVRDRKKALGLTALCMLLPVFILGEYIYSEAVIYPLFFTLMYCVLRCLKESSIRRTILIGVLGAVLYYTKPGAIVPAAAALLLLAVTGAVSKNKKALLHVLAGAGSLILCFFALKLIAEKALGYQGALLSLYDSQVSGYGDISLEHFWRALGFYPYYFLLACGVLPFIVSLWRYREYGPEERRFYLYTLICVLITVIGTAWVVNRPERKDILYLRYVEMYIPILFFFCFLPGKGKQASLTELRRKLPVSGILCLVLLVYATVCTVVWGCTLGIGTAYDTHFLISLAALFTPYVMGIANILAVFLIAAAAYLTVRDTDPALLRKCCCAVFAVLALLNNIQAYLSAGDNTDYRLAEETRAVHNYLGDSDYLFVYVGNQCDFGLDVNSRQNIVQVSSDEFIPNLIENNGCYVPFTPSSVRGMVAQNPTPDIDTLVVEERVYPRILFSKNTAAFKSYYDSFKVVDFIKGQRVADALATFAGNPPDCRGNSATIQVFNEDLIRQPVRIRLEIESTNAQNLQITGAGTWTIPLSEGRRWYEAVIDSPSDLYSLTAQGGEIQLYGFEITMI